MIAEDFDRISVKVLRDHAADRRAAARADVMLISVAEYESMQETLDILGSPSPRRLPRLTLAPPDNSNVGREAFAVRPGLVTITLS
jgi:hypothetical protein